MSGKNAERWLRDYEDWEDDVYRHRGFDCDEAIHQCKEREDLIDHLIEKSKQYGDSKYELYGKILNDLYVQHHRTVTAVRMKYGISERTMTRIKSDALWETAKLIPEEYEVLVPNKLAKIGV